MFNFIAVLALLICVGATVVLSSSNVTVYMEDYIRLNQRQYEAKVKKFEVEIATFRETYGRELRAISVQADLLELKLNEATERLRPLELIDSWHNQCVQNYSTTIPTVATVRAALTSCSTAAQSNLNGHLQNAQNTYNNLKSYHTTNVKNMLNDCEKRHPASQGNYTSCVTNAIATANVNTIANQKNFITYMEQAECGAKSRITQAWECSYTTVHNTISSLSIALRLIDDCIANKMSCASVSCTTGCKNRMIVNLSQADFLNTTINNPFIGLSSKLGCLEIKFKD
ncbi:uncharacterized protein LOC117567278 [Drosophila albomicans]|uniref:Uncharacterized protein LOC117567278 n=1 Tax=Drosophila albomicans TaxID=7291 RepID=A0A6P8WWW3_DROAB|nr:uncharacterized protein LOC117567278 [Drosophila albomicans]